MGVQSIIHGRVVIKGDYDDCVEIISNLQDDTNYPFLRAEMFSVGSNQRPYYYEEQIISFGASYNSVEDDWDSFILKFENLLEKLDFDTAKLQLETEFYGTFHFFWLSKSDKSWEPKPEYMLHKSINWFFGYGLRGRWGLLEENLDEEKYKIMGFKYPIALDDSILIEIQKIVDSLSTNEVCFLKNRIKRTDKIYPILTKLKLNNRVEFGFEVSKGLWVKRIDNDKLSDS